MSYVAFQVAESEVSWISTGQRRSTRLKQKEKVDYKKVDRGADLPKDSSSEVAEHMADGEHSRGYDFGNSVIWRQLVEKRN